MNATDASNSCLMFLIRHGATDNNLSNPPILQGNGINGPLSNIGQQQALRTASFLSNKPLDALYSSPMLRAMQTAEAIMAHHAELFIEEVPSLVEIHVGDWEGKNWQQIQASDPDLYQRHMDDPASVGYPGGESLQDVQDRCVPELLQIIQKHTGHIAVTAHNIVNRSMVSYLLGTPLKDVRKIRQDNCGINVIRRRGEKIELLTMNATSHLEND